MFKVHDYLRSEFRRYYPDATRIDVHEGTETWDVGVHLPDVPGDTTMIQFHMDVGSDDDRFTFISEFGNPLTVPFSPEMSS